MSYAFQTAEIETVFFFVLGFFFFFSCFFLIESFSYPLECLVSEGSLRLYRRNYLFVNPDPAGSLE